MIRKQKTPTVWWAFAALGIGVLGTIGMWAWRFGSTYWQVSNGGIVYLTWANARFCLLPWDILDCRQIFTMSGYANMRKITTFQFMVFAPLLAGSGIFGFGVWQRWLRQKERIILAGGTVADYPELVAVARKEQKVGALPLYGEWGLSDLRSLNGMVVFGAPGSGKSNFIRHLMQSATNVGDRQIVYAFKPEVYGLLPPIPITDENETGYPLLISPADRRSWVWDIAKEVTSVEECIELARYLVQGNDIEFFREAAQTVAAVIVIKLHTEKPGAWTWQELFDGVLMSDEEFEQAAMTYHPPALKLVTAEERQWDSVRSTLQIAFNKLQLLGRAWGDYSGRKAISIREFMQGERGPQTLVLGHSGRFDELSKLWIALFMTIATKSVFHEKYRRVKGRRTWFVLDEFSRLARIDGIDQLVTAGRERGVSAVLGLQDFHAIEATYGDHAFKTWMSSIQTKIICRTEPGETASWLMRILGKTRIRELRTKPGPNGGTVREWHEYEDSALREAEMSSELGVVKGKGTWVIVAGYGRDLYRVLVPFVDLDPHRKAYEASTWVDGAEKKTPPPIAAE
ncbi:type IV secretion system DNA-binding domain-containing protein [Aureimonas sp. AU12]|uniref:type IV secretion system DNA-binding domain-containing protein n=1 Tax=Aureimonas sp. AU12 TaxID=1638161 RepID=UPI000B0620E4|nr:type IV secretion system DNA-binding domain-containing protein [Aureimonas sp. AU12]